jgi:hypothetical protein
MIKDIHIPVVRHVTLAVAREGAKDEWRVYLINRNDAPLENVLISSTGYGERNGEEQKTSTLRHFIPSVEAHGHALVEPLAAAVLHLNNEYWLSYYMGLQLFDKRFVFLPGVICEENLTYIQELSLDGILHS